MKQMTVVELYEKLSSKAFMDTSDLFYNFFIYQYPVEREASMRRDIAEFKANLVRPVTYADVLTLDVFDAFREYLGQRSFGKYPSLLAYFTERDQTATDAVGHEKITRSLKAHAESEEFMKFVHERIVAHITQGAAGTVYPYVFLYGFGTIFPYLRASTFLDRYEHLNLATRYKVILFYPGVFHADENHFSLFGKLHEDHPYRSHVLVN